MLTDAGTYGYRAEDVVVLKDDVALPGHLQPTRENIVSFLPLSRFGFCFDWLTFAAFRFGICSCMNCGIWWPTPSPVIALRSSVRSLLSQDSAHSELVRLAHPSDSGHSNQQRSKGLNEEDFQDECKCPPPRSLAVMSSRSPAPLHRPHHD